MHELRWSGKRPRGALAAALRGWDVRLGGTGRPEAAVVATEGGRQPPAALSSEVPWLWVSYGAVVPEAAIEATRRGAYDAISVASAEGIARLGRRLAELFTPVATPASAAHFVAESAAARRLLDELAKAARTSMPVLLTGETGTGKEVAARLIHAWSARARGPIVPINCAAIPNEMMEGELFGYAKGAFSGSLRAYDGLIAAASQGTVFLDEIDDTPHSLQVKLLRVLEDRVVSRLGESTFREVDFRTLAATNRDLRELMARGQFGADLFERLAIVSIQLPPLRERVDDIPALAGHFIARFQREEPASSSGRVQSVSPEALWALKAYSWPGNIRELRNVVYGVLVSKRVGEEILLSDLPARVLRREPTAEKAAGVVDAGQIARRINDRAMNLRTEIEQLERAALEEALRQSHGNAALAAQYLGEVGRGSASDPGGTVRSMMRRLGLSRRQRG